MRLAPGVRLVEESILGRIVRLVRGALTVVDPVTIKDQTVLFKSALGNRGNVWGNVDWFPSDR